MATAIRTTSPAAFRRNTLPRLVGPAATPPMAMLPDTVTDGTSTSSVAAGAAAMVMPAAIRASWFVGAALPAATALDV